jgi:hypothetical protein
MLALSLKAALEQTHLLAVWVVMPLVALELMCVAVAMAVPRRVLVCSEEAVAVLAAAGLMGVTVGVLLALTLMAVAVEVSTLAPGEMQVQVLAEMEVFPEVTAVRQQLLQTLYPLRGTAVVAAVRLATAQLLQRKVTAVTVPFT